MRYKSRPITPVDAAMWNGDNIAEIQAICPQVVPPAYGTTLIFPSEIGPTELYIGEFIMREVGGPNPRYTKLSADVFAGLYMPQ